MEARQKRTIGVCDIGTHKRMVELLALHGIAENYDVVVLKNQEVEREELLQSLIKEHKFIQYIPKKESSTNPEPFYRKFEKKSGRKNK